MTVPRIIASWFLVAAGSGGWLAGAEPVQYEFGDIRIPAATGEEPLRETVSLEQAAAYLEQGSAAWNGQRKCVSCHTNGTYMAIRPALVPTLGEPPAATVEFFGETLTTLQQEAHENLKKSTRPAQVIYLANGLAEWDAHLTKSLSPSTEAALELMFAIQNENGTWGTLTCWPPLESDAYHEATVAAMAAATAPGWLDKVAASNNAQLKEAIERLRNYLRTETPPHDYSRVLLLWAESRWPGLIDEARKAELIAMLRQQQREDGGWSIRTFATPETWGSGNRAKKLRDEPDFDKPASDGHMTGLAIIALRSSDVPANDPTIASGVKWLKANQRESGRWWTRSLNTDTWHFITYSGTAYPLLALQMCDELPAVAKK
jgi:squalene-hopene/tetraprenyl-beta-curcumene cyclase